MKVLQINAVYGFGSTGIIVRDIENALINNGDESFVAYQTSTIKSEKAYKIGNVLDWKFHALYSRIFGNQAYASKCATKKFVKWIKKIQPDVVHLHNLHSNYINLNILSNFLKENNIPTVITMHDCWYFTGKCSHYVRVNCSKWQSCCGNCPLLKSEVPALFFDRTGNVLKDRTNHLNQIPNLALVGCSKWITREAEKSLLKPKYLENIYNGVDVDLFTPHDSNFKKKYNLEDKFIILGFASKWFINENSEIVNKILENLNEKDYVILLGCSLKQKEELKKYDKVLALDYIKDRQELADLYSGVDVFINLTHADTLPTVNMESICSGTKVITLDSCGSPELVFDGAGYVVEKGNPDLIIEAIDKVKKTGKLDEFALQKSRELYDKNKCYNNYIKLYQKILREKI